MKINPIELQDWEIAKEAEKNILPIKVIAQKLAIHENEIIQKDRYVAKIDFNNIWKRIQTNPIGKYIDVTAITPTPLGEGKTTTTIGLVEGLAKIGKRSAGAIRQPSSGPTFNIKGSAAGGGLSQCIPLAPFTLGLTGDIDAITNAHNLCMVALTARMQHEHNYDDDRLQEIGITRLDIDPERIQIKWAIDYCAQSLRNITIGKGSKMDGYEMESGFQISVSSELMSILSISKSLEDMRQRISKMIVAYSKSEKEITTADLDVDGAMTAIMVSAFNPNLVQTIEGNPILVHAGPFANISIGQNSVIADKIGVRMSEYLVTESGFGSDIGFEKFWNLKCRYSGLIPDAVVIVATVRALKMHGGGPSVKPGKPLDEIYEKEDLKLVKKGFENLAAHIKIVKKSGSNPVVCINKFHTDSDAEHDLIIKLSQDLGARCAVSDHWLKGGEGAIELAKEVVEAAESENKFKYLYNDKISLSDRIERIAKEVYNANGIQWSDKALRQIKDLEKNNDNNDMGICMVKTHLSISHDPIIKGVPSDWNLPIREILIYKGAGLIVPVAGDIKLLPGTGSNPGFRRIDVDTSTGNITGLF